MDEGVQHDRPSVKKLIQEHGEEIARVHQELEKEEFYDSNKHDDLWVLRFLLSHKKHTKVAVKAAKHTLQFRAEQKLDELDIYYCPINSGEQVPCQAIMRFRKYCEDDYFRAAVPNPQLGVIVLIVVAGIDRRQLVKFVDESVWMPSFLYASEWTHQWLDYVTRTTGRLTKAIRIVDLTGISPAKHMSAEATHREGKAMDAMEDCYPQMLQSLFFVHPPLWIEAPWCIFRPILPKRVRDKIVSPEKRERDAKKLLKYISADQLPVRYGGTSTAWPVDIPLPTDLNDPTQRGS